jgi:tetrapyrrole methylase family protein/MazG family protein
MSEDVTDPVRESAGGQPYASITDPFRRLVRIMERLQEPGGCPWDLEQTHESLKPYMIEEAYEALEAIDRGDLDELAGELGDVLLQVLFHSALARRSHRAFTIDDICQRAAEKMVRRHPHVFGDVVADNPTTVVRNWEALKAQERADQAGPSGKGVSGALSGVPVALPALGRAHRMQEKAGRQGVDWPDTEAARDEVRCHTERWLALSEQPDSQADQALAELLWSVVGAARLSGQHAEEALRARCDQFRRRFEAAETKAAETGEELADLLVQ